MQPNSTSTSAWTRPRTQRAVALVALCLVLLVPLARHGFAADRGMTITLGESLTDAQRQELLSFFGADGSETVITVTEEDTRRAMEGVIELSFTGAYSSTALTCRELGDGLDVTTNNINLVGSVTPALYAMALVTAGIGDATLVVAAPDGASSLGLTALTGVFETWDIAPCDSGNTSRERQRLALEQLTLTAAIGEALGTADGVQRATDVVLQAQQTIVTDTLTDRGAIDQAIAVQERAEGISIPAAQRAQLVDLMTRLANEDIDWSTFSAGWTIERNDDNTRITMTGDGIAIRNARATATAQAAAMMTATAQAEAATTATAEAEAAAAMMTATAEAEAALTATANANAQATADAQATEAANAQATQQAIAAMTATAAAQPTATPIPPIAVDGKIVSTDDGQVVVEQAGVDGTPAAFHVDESASITRAGTPVALTTVAKGDLVQMTVDGETHHVTVLSASPVSAGLLDRLTKLWPLLFGLLIPATLWARGRQPQEPFIVKRLV